MNTPIKFNSLSLSSSSSINSTPTLHQFFYSPRLYHHHHQFLGRNRLLVTPATRISCSIRRHLRRRRNNQHGRYTYTQTNTRTRTHTKPSPSDESFQMVIDIEQFSNKAPISVKRLLDSSELKLNEFIKSGNEALKDLQTLVTIDANQKVVVSCSRSTVRYVGNLVLWGLIIVVTFTVLVKLGLGFRNKLGFGYSGGGGAVVTRRDRSLGGREVVVSNNKQQQNIRKNEIRVPTNPLSLDDLGNVVGVSKGMSRNRVRRKEEKLPNWWPVSLPPPIVTDDNQEYQKLANRLIRAIIDYRMAGKDIMVDEIVQLRRICRTSGVRVSIEPTNARDSLYRASVNYVLDICVSFASQSGHVELDGEGAREFVVGLADNIGLDNIRAARIVAAAVAARTRSWLLQAWALEMQGKHSEGLAELSKLCLIHQIFPPEECSPEMEMVARGLEKNLNVEQREHLIKMLAGVCSEESYRSAAEALGLVFYPLPFFLNYFLQNLHLSALHLH
ncbi:hypothetical protein LguiB_013030 [Lonicera macranthoides]